MHSHAQVEEGTEDTSDNVSAILEFTSLGDMDDDRIDKLSRSNHHKVITMLQTMIPEESVETPSLTNEDEAGRVNNFLGFAHCTERQQIKDGYQAFNLSNVNIPSDWVLLDRQSNL